MNQMMQSCSIFIHLQNQFLISVIDTLSDFNIQPTTGAVQAI